MCNVKMCQVVKSSTLCIYTYIYAYIYYIKRMRDVRSYLFHRSLPNANKKSMKKKPRMNKNIHACQIYLSCRYTVHAKLTQSLAHGHRCVLVRSFLTPVAEGVKIHTSFSPFMIGHMFWGTKGEFKTRSKNDLPHKNTELLFPPHFIVRKLPLSVKAYVILI